MFFFIFLCNSKRDLLLINGVIIKLLDSIELVVLDEYAVTETYVLTNVIHSSTKHCNVHLNMRNINENHLLILRTLNNLS